MTKKKYEFVVDQERFRSVLDSDQHRDATRLGKALAYALITTGLHPIDKTVFDEYGITLSVDDCEKPTRSGDL